MALTFNRNNTYIRNNRKDYFIGTNVPGAAYSRFGLTWNTPSIYTYFMIHSGPRLDIPYDGTSNSTGTWGQAGWNSSNPQLTNSVLLYWTKGTNNATYSTGHMSYFDSGNVDTSYVRFEPSFFNQANVVNSGTATWFSIVSKESGITKGVLTGTVGTFGSGADLQISDTNIVTENEYTIPEGFNYYVPDIF